MDESSAFLLVGLGFFLTIVLLCFMLEHSRNTREDRLETLRHERRVAEQREFGYESVQQTNISQQSFRRFIK